MNSPTADAEPLSTPTIKIAPQQAIVWALFLFSGICGLIYEVLWCRHLGLLFGNTVESMSAVLTAFMSGLALGSYVGGRICHRLKRPMMAYGILELAIGIYCAFLPWAFSAESPIIPFYRHLYGETGGSTGLSIARFSISFVLLLIPTTFMGATLPVLSQYLVRSRAFLGKTVGALYAINTLGAVLGAALTGFVLLPVLGKANSNWIAVVTNIVLGTLAIVFGMNAAAPTAMESESNENASSSGTESNTSPNSISNGQPPISPLALKLSILTFGITGFAALTTQIGWNHALSLAMGSSTYVFSLIVSVFILGLSFGGMWGARAAERTNDPLALLGKVLIAIGLGSVALTVLLGIGPKLNLPIAVWGKESGWEWQLTFQAIGIGLLIIGPTFLMGATMPLTMQVAARSDGAPGRTVGTIYAVNTVGSILGSFIGGLVILPWLEIRGTLLFMAMLYTVPGIVLYMLSKSDRDKRPPGEFVMMLIAVGATLTAALASPPWDPLTMSSGMYLLRDEHALQAVKQGRWSDVFPDLHKNTELKYYAEGATATVAVTQFKEYLVAPADVMDEPAAAGTTLAGVESTPKKIEPPPSRSVFSLTVGGKPDASSHGDMTTQMGLTLVPVLIHPKPEDVLVIGLGSGASAGAALTPDTIKNVDVVEMSPEVVEASFFFAPFTGLLYKPLIGRNGLHWLDTPRLTLIVNDGRNHLLLTSKKYDVIASEPSNPWLAGVGNLFTKEAFQLSRDHLKPGGVMCQWIHSYSLEETDFFSIVKTFGDVFPHMELWCVNRRDFLLIGTDAPVRMAMQDLRARMGQKNVKPLLESIRFDAPEEFIACFMSSDSELRSITKHSALHTDDNMRLEFSAPKALYNTLQLMRSTQFEPDPEGIVDLSSLPMPERSATVALLDSAANGRDHTRCAFEHAGNRIDHWSKALALAPKQFWTVEYAAFIEAALKKRPAESTATVVPDAQLEAIQKQLDRDGITKTLEALQKLDQTRVASGSKSLECAELSIRILRASGDKKSAQQILVRTLKNPANAENANTGRLWALASDLALDFETADIAAAVAVAQQADAIAKRHGQTQDAVARAWLKAKKLGEAYNEYRYLCATNPKSAEFKIGLADTLISIATDPKFRSEKPDVALRKLRYARRVSSEAATFLNKSPAAWLRVAQSNWELSKLDPSAAEFHGSEAKAAWAKLVELDITHLLKNINPAHVSSILSIEDSFKTTPADLSRLEKEIAPK